MKNHKPEYNRYYITYWPGEATGKVGVVFFGIILILAMIFTIWYLLEGGRDLGVIMTLLLPIVMDGLFVHALFQSIYSKVTVSEDGITYSNERTKKETTVLWDDVAVVYFHMDNWHGHNHFRIFLKGHVPKKYTRKCDYVLVPEGVDGKLLQCFIPSYLLVNDTIYDWE